RLGKNVNELDEKQFKTKVFHTMARPICKGLKPKESVKALSELNSFFGRNFTLFEISEAYSQSCVSHQTTLEYLENKG
ncbi:hypothetical protein, partial [Herbiconiux daphne]